MIAHVVMLKFKPENPEAAEETKTRLEALPPLIEQIKKYEIGINIIESERAYDLAIYSQFESLEELTTYNEHPEHQAVLGYIRTVITSVVAVDYEI